MKQVFIVLISVIMLSCKPQYHSAGTIYPSAEVNYLSSDEQTVTVRAVGWGNTENKAIINAEQKVFEVLFFRGLPNSNQKYPLISSDENSEMAKNKKYFDEFYSWQRYKTFVMSSVFVSDIVRVKGGSKMATLDIKVNLSALKNDLETFGVIRKFGY